MLVSKNVNNDFMMNPPITLAANEKCICHLQPIGRGILDQTGVVEVT